MTVGPRTYEMMMRGLRRRLEKGSLEGSSILGGLVEVKVENQQRLYFGKPTFRSMFLGKRRRSSRSSLPAKDLRSAPRVGVVSVRYCTCKLENSNGHRIGNIEKVHGMSGPGSISGNAKIKNKNKNPRIWPLLFIHNTQTDPSHIGLKSLGAKIR